MESSHAPIVLALPKQSCVVRGVEPLDGDCTTIRASHRHPHSLKRVRFAKIFQLIVLGCTDSLNRGQPAPRRRRAGPSPLPARQGFNLPRFKPRPVNILFSARGQTACSRRSHRAQGSKPEIPTVSSSIHAKKKSFWLSPPPPPPPPCRSKKPARTKFISRALPSRPTTLRTPRSWVTVSHFGLSQPVLAM